MAGDFNYEDYGESYAAGRSTDPRIEARVHAALGDARTILNVGAGTGSYEPSDRYVLAVEPSAAMRAQRPRHLAPAIRAQAEDLPFDDGAVDASMAVLTIHQWQDLGKGLREMQRVTRGPVVILTFDAEALNKFWLNDYIPDLIRHAQKRYPKIRRIREYLGPRVDVQNVPVPIDCTDGFVESYYGRPERLLDPAVRRAQSSWGFVDPEDERDAIAGLRRDLDSRKWDDRYGKLRDTKEYEGALRLVIAQPS